MDHAAGPARWRDAGAAAALLAIDPAGLKGIRLGARAGPVRDAWLQLLADLLPGAGWRRMTASTPDGRLLGGLDLAATLAAGRPVAEHGLLAQCQGGVLVAAMAERLLPATAALLGGALEDGMIRTERDGVSVRRPARFTLVALDESAGEDEALPRALADRLGLSLDLEGLSHRDLMSPAPDAGRIEAARSSLAGVVLPSAMLEALCALALAAGDVSLRRPFFLAQAARAAAALRGAREVEPADAALAARLVLGLPAAIAEDAPEESAEPLPPNEEGAGNAGDAQRQGESAELVLQAIAALLPPSLLDGSGERRARAAGAAGRSAAQRTGGRRGARVGLASSPPFPQARLDVLATLRAAAPWQRLRRDLGAGGRLSLRKSDFRYPRLKARVGSTAICVVDASGSAAAERMAEAKGAVEIILSQCYVRRDQVALIAFRGRNAEMVLEPTRSLVRAKRSVSVLPAGGGTPLAAGVVSALRAALAVRRKGGTVLAVFLTDGRGNVALDGSTAKPQVEADLRAVARQFRAQNVPAVVIDTALRPRGQASALARELGARFLALPRSGAQRLAGTIAGELART